MKAWQQAHPQASAACWITTAIALILIMLTLVPSTAGAYTIEKHNDPPTDQIILSPSKVELDMKPGDTASRDILLANRTDSTKAIVFSLEDFEGSQDPSQDTVFKGDEDSSYGARHWLEPELTSITLQPGEVLTFRTKITVPKNADPGGHYAVLFATTQSETSGQDQGSSINIAQRLGTLFLIRVEGNIDEAGSLNSPELPTLTEYGPINVGLVFNNTGNVHLKPHGKIYISNMLGQTVAEIDVNEWTVLPESSRRMTVPWDSHLLFGRYSVRAEIEYGTGDNKVIMSGSFWAFPWKIILAILSSLVIIVILLSWATRGRRMTKAAQKAELDQLRAGHDAAAAAAAAGETPAWAAAAEPRGVPESPSPLAEPREPAAEGAPVRPAEDHMPLSDLFPSMNDNRMIDINDNETRKLLRTMIDNELDLARAYIAEGRNEEARRELQEARQAAQKLGLLFEVGLIDDMLHWA